MIRYQDKIPVFIVTKGDTNQWNDPFMLKPNQVIGILKRKYLLISSSFGWMIAKISLLNTFWYDVYKKRLRRRKRSKIAIIAFYITKFHRQIMKMLAHIERFTIIGQTIKCKEMRIYNWFISILVDRC